MTYIVQSILAQNKAVEFWTAFKSSLQMHNNLVWFPIIRFIDILLPCSISMTFITFEYHYHKKQNCSCKPKISTTTWLKWCSQLLTTFRHQQLEIIMLKVMHWDMKLDNLIKIYLDTNKCLKLTNSSRHLVKQFLDTSKSLNFPNIFCIKQIKSISRKADKCLLYFGTNW